MKFLFLILLFSCSSIQNPDSSGDGFLDKAMRDDDCGLVDKFYDGCRNKAKAVPVTAPKDNEEDTFIQ